MKTTRHLFLVGICVALLNLSNALHSNLESLSILNDGVHNVDELFDNIKNKYSEEEEYTNPSRTINNLNESYLKNANMFSDESNSDEVPSDDDSYQNAAAAASAATSEVLPEASENLSEAYAKLIELSSLDGDKSYDMMYDKQKIQKHTHKGKRKEKAYIRVKSAKNLNNRESIQINKFETQNVKKKNINFLQSSKEDLLSSDLIGADYVLENAVENAFEDNVHINTKVKSPAVVESSRTKSGKIMHKNVKKSNKGKSARHVVFIEKSKKKHRESSHSKNNKQKNTHRTNNNSESHDKSRHKDSVNKKHAKHRKDEHINKSNKLGKAESHLQTDSESVNIEEENDEDTEVRNTEDTEQSTPRKYSNDHSPKNENDKAREMLDTEKETRTHTSPRNKDDDDNDDHSDDDSENGSDDDNDDDGEGNQNLMLKHEIDAIKKNSKVYKLNLFNCSFINDWDFAHQYVEEVGSLVKLSGYVFQNMQDTDAMPTSNTGDWKLKGACDFTKYVCGALNFMPNQYNKGDRVIFEDRLYEALMNTELSPQDDGSSWVDKTNDCEEQLIDK